jgi:predicted protein tyrosine phosphatase
MDLKTETEFLRLIRADRDRLRRCAQLLVPCFDGVRASRKTAQIEAAVLAGGV